jgi:hypothetical protein
MLLPQAPIIFFFAAAKPTQVQTKDRGMIWKSEPTNRFSGFSLLVSTSPSVLSVQQRLSCARLA